MADEKITELAEKTTIGDTDVFPMVDIAAEPDTTKKITGANLKSEVLAGAIKNSLLTTRGDMIYRDASAPARLAKGSSGQVLTMGADDPGWATPQSNVVGIEFIIDGSGSAITTGQKGHIEIPFACTITQVTTLADQSGSIVVDIWKDTYANFPPTSADSICASAKPTLSSAQKAQDSTLTGWTKSISAGDILAFNVDSCTTITRCLISIKATKS